MMRRRLEPRVVPCVFLLSCTILLSYSPVLISGAVVTLDSIAILKTHEWIPTEPEVFFECKSEKRIYLPDVKQKNVVYTFKGEESWQPLTKLHDAKCKRCGLFERDAIKAVHMFDEWELCPSDFKKSNGKYTHVKEKEFNATFLCSECVQLGNGGNNIFNMKNNSSWIYWALIAVIAAAVLIVLIAGIATVYKYWQKRMRQKQQARFLQMFEEADDIEDELGIGPTGGSN